jgi:hypothetical protein
MLSTNLSYRALFGSSDFVLEEYLEPLSLEPLPEPLDQDFDPPGRFLPCWLMLLQSLTNLSLDVVPTVYVDFL